MRAYLALSRFVSNHMILVNVYRENTLRKSNESLVETTFIQFIQFAQDPQDPATFLYKKKEMFVSQLSVSIYLYADIFTSQRLRGCMMFTIHFVK